jgi:hypothetical protein
MVADDCGRIGVHEQPVRGWIKTGELTAITFGSRIGYRIRVGDYDDFLTRRATTDAISRLLASYLSDNCVHERVGAESADPTI